MADSVLAHDVVDVRSALDPIETRRLVDDLVAQGFTRATAKRTVRATLGVLGERLTTYEAECLAAHFVGEGRMLIRASRHQPGIDAAELFARVRRRLSRGVTLDTARERAEAVLAAIGRRVPRDARAQLERALPPELATVLQDAELAPEA